MESSASTTVYAGPPINGLNHIKLPVFSLRRTIDFYTKILPFTYLPQYDHFTPEHKRFAAMFIHKPSNLLIEARYLPSQAEAQKGWDPVTFGVGVRKDLEEWATWFDQHGVRHSKVMEGIKGWVLCAEDPDGKVVRLYVEDEEHEWTDKPDVDTAWIEKFEADPDDGTN